MNVQLIEKSPNWQAQATASLMCFMALVLMACSPVKTSSNYSAVHQNTLSAETLSLEIAGGLDHEMTGPAFQYLMREFHMRAKGPLAIEVRRTDLTEEEIARNITNILEALHHAGVSDDNIIVLPTPAGDDLNAVISFTANMINVPDCGDWSTSGTYNLANVPQGNFGCSTQRNLGLMIANPGDLKSAQTMSNMSGNRGATIVRSVLGTAAPAEAEAGAAEAIATE